MIHIAFIGNCQTVSLCFYLQQLLINNNDYKISWCLYGDEFKSILNNAFAIKCNNKIIDYTESLKYINNCDYIIYQTISKEKSPLLNEDNILLNIKNNAKLIKIPSIYFDNNSTINSMKELKNREFANNVTIPVSHFFEKYNYDELMLTVWHPTTFLFLEILKKITVILNIDFFSVDKYNHFISDKNYIGLP